MKRNILLNPGPATTTDTVKKALVVPDICPRESEFCEVVDEVRKLIVQVVHGEGNYACIPITSSGTGAVEACISSVVPQGKKILIHVNGAYGMRMLDIARTHYDPKQVLTYEQKYGDYPNPEDLEQILKQDPTISTFAFVHHETTTGMLNPAEQFLAVAKKYNVKIAVDAMSSFGGIPIDVRKHPYDYLISSANKCIQGMAGISFIVCKKESLQELSKIPAKTYYFDLWRQYEALEKAGQMAFTPPVQLFYALRQALKELLKETVEGRYARYSACWEVLQGGLKNLKLKSILDEKYQSRLLTTVREPSVDGYDFMKMHDVLYQKGFTIYPGKIVQIPSFRLANIGDITPRDMSGFIDSLEEYFQSLD